jgi:large subunit ribosomal protein L35
VPKIKTNRGAAKRFSVTASGKIKHKKNYASHILTKKSTSRKRNLRQVGFISKADEKNIRELIPYAK